MQSMMVSQVEINKQQLNNVEIITSAVMPSPASRKHVF